MLKKIIVGILCFIILAATGCGIYIYTLDWNKHKALVAQRFSQITGLKAVIEGNLDVKLFPSPKFSAGKVKFYKTNGGKTPLVVVNDLTTNVDLMPLLDNNFVVKSMTLAKAEAYVEINEKGVSNWDGVGANSNTKSGNIEVSFNDIRVTNSTLIYKNLEDNSQFNINNISANISAPTLSGPYKTSGKFIHNNSEILFKGNVAKNDGIALKIELANAATGSVATLDGSLGSKAKGTVTLDTKSLYDVSNIIWGNDAITNRYNSPLYLSFQYNYDRSILKLDNFTTKFDKNTAGSGTVIINHTTDIPQVNASFDLTKFDLNLFESLAQDIIDYNRAGKKFAESPFAGVDFSLSAKATSAWYNNVEARNLTMAINVKQNIVDIARFGVIMPGETIIKTVGKVNLNNGVDYIFNQAFDTKDLRTFASIFNLDLAKLASDDNKKSIFKRAQADIKVIGNMDSIKISIPRASIDAIDFNGNLGIVKKDKVFVLADMNVSKVILDKYLLGVPSNLKTASLKDKFIYQMNLIPWNRDLNVDAEINASSVVYNDIPMEKLYIHFTSEKDAIDIAQFSVKNFAGADVNLKMNANNVFSVPHFNELSFDVKTDNFPMFTSTLGIDTGDKTLFKRKLFAIQGALSGSFDEFSLSSVQKFGDTEFAYTGVVNNQAKTPLTIAGDLELKTNNFNSFIKALNFNYSADIPVTTFALTSKIKGSKEAFSLNDFNAYLGANAIKGTVQFNNTGLKPQLTASLDFDKFDADRWFNLSKNAVKLPQQKSSDTFITKNLSNEKIDYSPLSKLDFNIKASAKQLNFYGQTYTNTKTDISLKDNLLKVASLDANIDKSIINLRFDLTMGDLPRIDGYFNVKDLKTPEFGGSLYVVENGWLTAEGTFNAPISSKADFFENLNSKGKFNFTNTAIRGWDLDIIKFELEQRKSVAGFEDTVQNSLKSGKSSFSRIRGNYNISKGFVVADSVIWESPVLNMNLKFDLNLSDWIFHAVFNAVYHNASFSDILKFSYDGDLANPVLKLDLSESIKRISEIEDRIKNARQYKEKEKMEKIGGKLKSLQRAIDGTLQDINRLTLDVVRFKPITKNENVVSVYEENLKTINTAEINIKKMKDLLNTYPDEETLINIEADLGAEKAKLRYIPKVLEENFVVDSKYIFDDTFNKIAWIYNLSQNNYAYHRSLTDVYMAQVELLKTSTSPVSEEDTKKLVDGIDKTKEVMDNISALHGKIRDNYLNIIDSVKVSQMKENNEIAQQALETLLTYSKQLYNDIVINIDDFRSVLGINARDYDQYMLYPPETTADIDIKQPTIKSGNAPSASSLKDVPDSSSKASDATDVKQPSSDMQPSEEKDKKKEALNLALQSTASNGLSQILGKLKEEKDFRNDVKIASNLDFGGLSGLFKSNIASSKDKAEVSSSSKLSTETVKSEQKHQEVVVAENNEKPVADKKANKEVVLAQNTNVKEPKEVQSNNEERNQLLTAATDNNLLEKTKNAIAKILSKIKKQEKNLEKDIAANNIVPALPASNQKTASKQSISSPEKTKDLALLSDVNNVPTLPSTNKKTLGKDKEISTLKVNPVVALNIGKETSSNIISEPTQKISHREKFKKVARAEDATSPKPLSQAQIDKFSKYLDDALEDETSAPDNTQLLIAALPRPQTSLDITAVNALTDDALITVNTPEEKIDTPSNRYVLHSETNVSPQLSGTVGKEMLKTTEKPVLKSVEHKYLFAANSAHRLNFSGNVAKTLSLTD